MSEMIHKLVSGRSEEHFKMVQLAVLGHRTVLTVGDDGFMDEVKQTILSYRQMMERIAECGTVINTDEYADLTTGHKVIRGRVEIHGVEHAFMFMYDEIYEKLLDAALFGLRFAKNKGEK